jgi:hypothetical protein
VPSWPDPRSSVCQRIGNFELVAQVLNERPEVPHRRAKRPAVLLQVASLDELAPRHGMGTRCAGTEDRCVGSAPSLAPLEPVVQGRPRNPQYLSGKGLVVQLAPA